MDCRAQAVRGELHTVVRKTVVDWLLRDDHPRDIKIYVTGHSMGGALATHCAMDLQVIGPWHAAVRDRVRACQLQ